MRRYRTQLVVVLLLLGLGVVAWFLLDGRSQSLDVADANQSQTTLPTPSETESFPSDNRANRASSPSSDPLPILPQVEVTEDGERIDVWEPNYGAGLVSRGDAVIELVDAKGQAIDPEYVTEVRVYQHFGDLCQQVYLESYRYQGAEKKYRPSSPLRMTPGALSLHLTRQELQELGPGVYTVQIDCGPYGVCRHRFELASEQSYWVQLRFEGWRRLLTFLYRDQDGEPLEYLGSYPRFRSFTSPPEDVEKASPESVLRSTPGKETIYGGSSGRSILRRAMAASSRVMPDKTPCHLTDQGRMYVAVVVGGQGILYDMLGTPLFEEHRQEWKDSELESLPDLIEVQATTTEAYPPNLQDYRVANPNDPGYRQHAQTCFDRDRSGWVRDWQAFYPREHYVRTQFSINLPFDVDLVESPVTGVGLSPSSNLSLTWAVNYSDTLTRAKPEPWRRNAWYADFKRAEESVVNLRFHDGHLFDSTSLPLVQPANVPHPNIVRIPNNMQPVDLSLHVPAPSLAAMLRQVRVTPVGISLSGRWPEENSYLRSEESVVRITSAVTRPTKEVLETERKLKAAYAGTGYLWKEHVFSLSDRELSDLMSGSLDLDIPCRGLMARCVDSRVSGLPWVVGTIVPYAEDSVASELREKLIASGINLREAIPSGEESSFTRERYNAVNQESEDAELRELMGDELFELCETTEQRRYLCRNGTWYDPRIRFGTDAEGYLHSELQLEAGEVYVLYLWSASRDDLQPDRRVVFRAGETFTDLGLLKLPSYGR